MRVHTVAGSTRPPFARTREGLGAPVRLIALTLCSLGPGLLEVAAEEPPPTPEPDSVRHRIDELQKQLDELRREAGIDPEARPAEAAGDTEAASEAEPSDLQFTPFWKREAIETPRSLRGLYDRPFLASLWRRAHIGGYTELEYHDFEDGTLGVPEGFRMHRTNLFLYSEITDQLRFAGELEFETEFDGKDVNNEIETKVEMAFVDWKLYEELVVRGGAIVVPLGRVNVNHDGPVRELTDRPLVSTFVIPTTFTEAGAGAHGRFRLADSLSLGYEAYAVNGFNLLDRDGDLSSEVTEPEQILREGTTSIGGDNNGSVSSTGRLSLLAFDMLDIGGSWHVGTYDERADNFLRIFAGDVSYAQELHGVEVALEGEIALADFQRDAFARTSGVPDEFWGFYTQIALSSMPRWLADLAPHVFGDPGARFTAVFRYDWVDLDGDRGEAFEPGINFRPAADTVFKFSYKFTQKSIGLRNLPGRGGWDDDGFVFSLTSYF